MSCADLFELKVEMSKTSSLISCSKWIMISRSYGNSWLYLSGQMARWKDLILVISLADVAKGGMLHWNRTMERRLPGFTVN